MLYDGYPNVIGIDVQDDNIEYGLAMGAPVELGDAHDLKYDDASFDVVFIRSSLEHMFSPYKVIEEAYRVLKDGGLIFINVPHEPQGIDDLDMSHSFVFTKKSILLEMLTAFRKVCFYKDDSQMKYLGKKGGTRLDMALIRTLLKGHLISLSVKIHPRKIKQAFRLLKP